MASVTDSRIPDRARAAADTDSRDCWRCGASIPATEAVYIYGGAGATQRYYARCEACVIDHIRRCREDKDDLSVKHIERQFADLRACEVCERPLRAHPTIRVCSTDCKSQLPAAAARARRRAMREAVTPETFVCAGCEKPIEGTVCFWWTKLYPRPRYPEATWCEPCWADMRTAEGRRMYERYGESPTILGTTFPDPDANGYDPFAQIGEYGARPCGHCGRSIRWGIGYRFCCGHCMHEARKAGRRVGRAERQCEVCNEVFVPKRADARTCSDRCRQRKRRGRVTGNRVAPAVSAASDADSRDGGEK